MSHQISYGRRLTQLAQEAPDRLAFVHVDPEGREREVTRGEIERRANQVARLLAGRGVGTGSLVAVSLANRPEHFFATYGAWKCGATVLPMRWSLPEWERDRLLSLAGPAAVVTADDLAGRWPAVSPEDIEGSTVLDDAPLADRVPDPARAIATSGSTGSPKLIVSAVPGLIEDAVTNNPLVIANEQIIQLVTSPLYHTNGFGCHMRLLAGGSLVVLERFDAERVVELVRTRRVNHIILVPTMLQRIARLPDVDRDDLRTLEHIYYGGAPLAPWIAHRWFQLVEPEKFYFQYGGTEELGGTMARGDEWLGHVGTVGRPRGCDLRILDDADREVPPGEVGTIFFRRHDGSAPFRYVGSPPPRATDEGFTTYGDLGWVDQDGYLFIADRRVDMVITGGANVYPAEVEAAMSEHPGIADVAVIGLPHAEWGQALHALVEPVDPAVPLSDDDLDEHCRVRLAPYKVPKTFELVERLPRTEAGKINRYALAAARQGAAVSVAGGSLATESGR